ncbi:MAG: hypothetical protein ACI4U2_04810, partial [Christensenellaceae bacterium]
MKLSVMEGKKTIYAVLWTITESLAIIASIILLFGKVVNSEWLESFGFGNAGSLVSVFQEDSLFREMFDWVGFPLFFAECAIPVFLFVCIWRRFFVANRTQNSLAWGTITIILACVISLGIMIFVILLENHEKNYGLLSGTVSPWAFGCCALSLLLRIGTLQRFAQDEDYQVANDPAITAQREVERAKKREERKKRKAEEDSAYSAKARTLFLACAILFIPSFL